jgi:ribulose-phosphate 3-epimerase
MTVNPGFGGQEFIKSVLPKIEQISQIIEITSTIN